MKEQVFKLYEEIFRDGFRGMGFSNYTALNECKALMSVVYEVPLEQIEMFEKIYPMKGVDMYYESCQRVKNEEETKLREYAWLLMERGFDDMKKILM